MFRSTDPTRKVRWRQFGLRTLLVVVLVAGLALAWYSRELRRQERIARAVQLLAAAPTQFDMTFDPTALVRAVNHLHGMGKADSIRALRQFAEQHANDGSPLSDHQTLKIVVPLLFDRIDPEDRYPNTDVFGDPGNYTLEYNQWPDSDFWICCQDDIPFRCQSVGGFSGMDADRTYLIDWAERRARLRLNPLRPADDPIEAAENLIARLFPEYDERKPSDVILVNQVRGDAFRAVKHLVVHNESDERRWSFPDDEEWDRLKCCCHELGIRWSERKQKYVATKPEK
jgi:hypothetical protein